MNNEHIHYAQNQVDETSGLMEQNISSLIERGEKMELISMDARTLETSSGVFKKSTTKLKCQLIRKNFVLFFIILGLSVVIFIIIGLSIGFNICDGWNFSTCNKYFNNSNPQRRSGFLSPV